MKKGVDKREHFERKVFWQPTARVTEVYVRERAGSRVVSTSTSNWWPCAVVWLAKVPLDFLFARAPVRLR